jgi:hypothetical protein
LEHEDCISNFIEAADINFEQDFILGTSLCASAFQLTWSAHLKYSKNRSTLDHIVGKVAEQIEQLCWNSYSHGVPVVDGWGASFNVFFKQREKILRVSCTRDNVTLEVGTSDNLKNLADDRQEISC